MRITDKVMRRTKVVMVIVLFINVRSLLSLESAKIGAAMAKKRVTVNFVPGPRERKLQMAKTIMKPRGTRK